MDAVCPEFFKGIGLPKHSHNGIADILVERALVFKDDSCHLSEIFVEQFHQLIRGQRLGNLRKVSDITEKDRNDFSIPSQIDLDILFDDLIHNLGREVSS